MEAFLAWSFLSTVFTWFTVMDGGWIEEAKLETQGSGAGEMEGEGCRAAERRRWSEETNAKC